jgi:hypothetical protein
MNLSRPSGVSVVFVSILLSATSTVVRSQSVQPPRRAHHAMVYDEAHHRVLMSGGSTPVDEGRSFTFFNDLWSFDGARWVPLPPSGDRLSGSRLAFDAPQQRIVSFGGYDGRESRGDVRVIEADAWRTLGSHPDVRAAEPGFVYDARRDRFVLFGGSAGRGDALGATWEYDRQRWTRVTTPNPPARQAHVMVFDERRGRTVVFGGMGGATTPGQPPPSLGDTWEFDGTTWTERRGPGPSPRNGAGAAYDSKRGVLILFGGAGSGGFMGDTWSWDGSAWRKLADSGPAARAMGYLAYDKGRDRVVLFGGRNGYPNGDLNDTWEWDGSTWRQVRF